MTAKHSAPSPKEQVEYWMPKIRSLSASGQCLRLETVYQEVLEAFKGQQKSANKAYKSLRNRLDHHEHLAYEVRSGAKGLVWVGPKKNNSGNSPSTNGVPQSTMAGPLPVSHPHRPENYRIVEFKHLSSSQ